MFVTHGSLCLYVIILCGMFVCYHLVWYVCMLSSCVVCLYVIILCGMFVCYHLVWYVCMLSSCVVCLYVIILCGMFVCYHLVWYVCMLSSCVVCLYVIILCGMFVSMDFMSTLNIFHSSLTLHEVYSPISLEMPVPSQGHYGFHSFPVVD